MKIAGYKVKHLINPKRWYMYLRWVLRKWLFPNTGTDEWIVAFSEQLIYRRFSCSDCVALGKCKECKCKVNGLMLDPIAEDSLGKWGKMMKVEEWNKFKEEHNLKFVVTSGDSSQEA